MASLEEVQRNWEIYAKADPMWAALMDPELTDRRWNLQDFLDAGDREISTVFERLQAEGIEPRVDGDALDFGCGIGRLTQALGNRFASATGIDISPTMVELAQDANHRPDRCSYVLNESGDLSQLGGRNFAFIYTSVVLQHMEPRFSLEYARQLSRLLEPGGIFVFQVPDHLNTGRTFRQKAVHRGRALQRAVGLRTRARRAARRLGIRRGPEAAGEAIAEMHCLPEEKLRSAMQDDSLEIVDVAFTNSTELEFARGLRYLDSEPDTGYVSKQYTVRRVQNSR